MQLATSGQSGSQAGDNKADGDNGEDDGDDGKIDTTTMELIISRVYDGHFANCVWTGLDICATTSVLERGGRKQARKSRSSRGERWMDIKDGRRVARGIVFSNALVLKMRSVGSVGLSGRGWMVGGLA